MKSFLFFPLCVCGELMNFLYYATMLNCNSVNSPFQLKFYFIILQGTDNSIHIHTHELKERRFSTATVKSHKHIISPSFHPFFPLPSRIIFSVPSLPSHYPSCHSSYHEHPEHRDLWVRPLVKQGLCDSI